MKYEKLLQLAISSPDFLCESGSHLYGMSTPTSDYDLRGFVFSPFPYLIGVRKFKCQELEGDTKIYSTKAFLKLVLKGDPLCSELFYADEKHIKECSKWGREILNLKDDIISNTIYGRIMGYSNNEWRKAMGVKIVSKTKKREKGSIISDIREIWKPTKEKMDEIVKILDSFDEKKIVSSVSGLGSKRKKDIEEFGFCRKSAAHSIRLIKQIIELMETGKITFPRPDKDILLGIRNGTYTKEEVEEIYTEAVCKAEKARDKSILPDKPNEKKVWEVYLELVVDILADTNDLKNIGRGHGTR